ncbi:MAG: hypothetical protein H0X40_04550 [Chthoniobacterales bacterium]|nr:hypothetical protein [Chthoniobacterales bacterium]
MRMIHSFQFGVIAASSLFVAAVSYAQGDSNAAAAQSSMAPYTEGSVWVVTMVKVKAGMSDDYIKSLGHTIKPVMEEQKKQNLILDYKILDGDASGAQDFNMLLMVEYANMAALDGLRAKTDPITEKIMGSEDQRRALAIKRFEVRDIVGVKTMREITLK